jgi:WD40 repeat protein
MVRRTAIRLIVISLFVFVPGQPMALAGRHATPPSTSRRILAGENPLAGRLWLKRYNGTANSSDVGGALGVSPDGSRVFVTGGSLGSGSGSDYATLAYDTSTGAKVWAMRYGLPNASIDTATALGVSPTGSVVFVTGSASDGSARGPDYATVAHAAATGRPLWVRRYNSQGNGDDHANALGVSPDGSKVFVTGSSSDRSTGEDDYATVAYAAATGMRLWTNRYNGPGSGGDIAFALDESPDGSKVFVTGQSGSDYATVAYDAFTGAQLWAAPYNGPGDSADGASAVAASPDGSSVLVTGGSLGSDGYDYATVAYDASSGAQLWAAPYNGPGNADDFASAVVMSADGSTVFVTGESAGSLSFADYATLAYDVSTGEQLWESRYNGQANADDYAFALGASPDGSTAFVTGQSAGSTSSADYATVAYDALSGGQLWEKRYDGPAHDYDVAHALGVSPDGARVFVTGGSPGSQSGNDYATLAYSTP